MSNAANKLIQAAAGNAGEAVYVDDLFSTYLYDGTGSSLEINNGMDLSGEGGLVWIKGRTQNTATQDHRLVDTERGVNEAISSALNDNVLNITGEFTSFDNDGFTLASTSGNGLNKSGEEYVSWTFRNQPGFFEVVKYEGNGTAGRTVSHNLGSAPGCIIVKRVESGQSNGDFFVYHRGNTAAPETDYLLLNGTGTTTDSASAWNDTAPTATEFTLGSSSDVNASSNTYIAYLFAHDDQSFGEDSDESIIKCGSYTGNGSTTSNDIDIGFEPQWVLIKNTTSNNQWYIFDVMRGIASEPGGDAYLLANTSGAEVSSENYIDILPNGFSLRDDNAAVNASSSTYIYMAIRRPHKPASEFAATDLFKPVAQNFAPGIVDAGFPIDFVWHKQRGSSNDNRAIDRLRGGPKTLKTNSTGAEGTESFFKLDNMDGLELHSLTLDAWIFWMWRRAPGFFDVVTYTGNGSGTNDVSHNLGVKPELVICKSRTTGTFNWPAITDSSISSAATLFLNTNSSNAGGSSSGMFTDTIVKVGSTGGLASLYGTQANNSNDAFVMYLFATVAGISKVGTYSGTGSDVNVDCGFSSGARFILIKRSDSTGDWYVWDTARGIVAGDDPYVLVNSNAAEVTNTDYIDPLSSGFTVTSSAPAALNTSGGTYIFLAFA